MKVDGVTYPLGASPANFSFWPAEANSTGNSSGFVWPYGSKFRNWGQASPQLTAYNLLLTTDNRLHATRYQTRVQATSTNDHQPPTINHRPSTTTHHHHHHHPTLNRQPPPSPSPSPYHHHHRPSPPTINHRPSTINHQHTITHHPSSINHQPPTINHRNHHHQPSTITINHQPSIINHRPPTPYKAIRLADGQPEGPADSADNQTDNRVVHVFARCTIDTFDIWAKAGEPSQ